MNSSPKIDVEKEISQTLTIHKNVGQEVMVTTVDKVHLCLIQNRDCLTAKREWVMPLSLFCTVLATLLATDFKDFILKANVWEAIFLIGLFVFGFWFLRSAWSAFQLRNTGGIEQIIGELKESSSAGTIESDDNTNGT